MSSWPHVIRKSHHLDRLHKAEIADFDDLINAVLAAIDTNQPRTIWIAYSGGMDSHVLLHSCYLAHRQQKLGQATLSAVHIDHQLQRDSNTTATHCQAVCRKLAIPLRCIAIDVAHQPGMSLQAAARSARYAAMAACLGANDYLLSAHHREDQAETLLLQMLRGCGMAGMAAMPQSRALGLGQHLRPFLSVAHAQLQRAALNHQLQWREDPSNRLQDYDRNYIRQSIWPQITERWPSAASTLSRVATHAANSDSLIRALGQMDGAQAQASAQSIALDGLQALPDARRDNALRHWLYSATGQFVPHKLLDLIYRQVICAKRDTIPCIRYQAFAIRRYRNWLWIEHWQTATTATQRIHWQDRQSPLPIPCIGISLPIQLIADYRDCQLIEVGFRSGGETIQLPNRPRKKLKKLLQELSILPWQRHTVPLIYVDQQLVDLYLAHTTRLPLAFHGEDDAQDRPQQDTRY